MQAGFWNGIRPLVLFKEPSEYACFPDGRYAGKLPGGENAADPERNARMLTKC